MFGPSAEPYCLNQIHRVRRVRRTARVHEPPARRHLQIQVDALAEGLHRDVVAGERGRDRVADQRHMLQCGSLCAGAGPACGRRQDGRDERRHEHGQSETRTQWIQVSSQMHPRRQRLLRSRPREQRRGQTKVCPKRRAHSPRTARLIAGLDRVIRPQSLPEELSVITRPRRIRHGGSTTGRARFAGNPPASPPTPPGGRAR